MIMSAMAIPAFADQPYYPCYEGTWNIRENSGTPIELQINKAGDGSMTIHFQYGQFAVTTYGSIYGKKVKSDYYEVWDDMEHIFQKFNRTFSPQKMMYRKHKRAVLIIKRMIN